MNIINCILTWNWFKCEHDLSYLVFLKLTYGVFDIIIVEISIKN
jgi:hypothetical protein